MNTVEDRTDDIQLAESQVKKCVIFGCGNMGASVARAILSVDWGREGTPLELSVVEPNQEQLTELVEESKLCETPVRFLASSAHLECSSRQSPALFILAVKPNQIDNLLISMREKWVKGDLLLSIAAGVSVEHLKNQLGKDAKKVHVIRAMPNLAAHVGMSVTGVLLSSKEVLPAVVEKVLLSLGEVVYLEKEADFHAFTALAGSMPAFLFVALEALADGAVEMGMNRLQARKIALKTMQGSLCYAEKTRLHTAELKDRVASPGGTTIAGLESLEKDGFRYALISAIKNTAEKSIALEESKSRS